MRILAVHNRYLQPGGEDVVLDREVENLRVNGHEVLCLLETNEALREAGPAGLLKAAVGTVWSQDGYRALARRLGERRFDLVHVHNTFPRLSPSIYWAAQRANVPVVQTLHNYRLICANAMLLRNGSVCTDCVGRFPVSALRFRCYRDSLAGTSAVVAMQRVHRLLGTWRSHIHAYIALTEFARGLMVEGGLPAGRVHVKPNFVADPLQGQALPIEQLRSRRVLFAGRVTHEKGLDMLLGAWAEASHAGWTLDVVGDGPDLDTLREQFSGMGGVRWHGWLDREDLANLMQEVRFLVLPSRWYEGLPMVLVEALAHGVPCIVPNHGGMIEVVGDGQASLSFRPGSSEALTTALSGALSAPDSQWREWSRAGREHYLQAYTPQANYTRQMQIYRAAMMQRRA